MIRPLIDRARFKRLATRQIIFGSVALALALVLVHNRSLSAVFGHLLGNLAAGGIAVLVVLLWWVLPKVYRAGAGSDAGRNDAPARRGCQPRHNSALRSRSSASRLRRCRSAAASSVRRRCR